MPKSLHKVVALFIAAALLSNPLQAAYFSTTRPSVPIPSNVLFQTQTITPFLMWVSPQVLYHQLTWKVRQTIAKRISSHLPQNLVEVDAGAIGQGSSMLEIPHLSFSNPTVPQGTTLSDAIDYLQQLEIQATASEEAQELFAQALERLKALQDNKKIKTFPAIIRSSEDYLLALGQPDQIAISNEVFKALNGNIPAMAELLFHEAYASLESERDKFDHKDRYEGVQREIFGPDNALGLLLRDYIDLHSPNHGRIGAAKGRISRAKRDQRDYLIQQLIGAGIQETYAKIIANILMRLYPGSLEKLKHWGILESDQLAALQTRDRKLTIGQMARLAITLKKLVDSYEAAEIGSLNIERLLGRLVPLPILSQIQKDTRLSITHLANIVSLHADFETWIYRYQSIVWLFYKTTSGIPNAWIAVIGKGGHRAEDWKEKADPVAKRIQVRVGGEANAWRIIFRYGIEIQKNGQTAAEKWVDEAVPTVDEIESKVGGRSQAWTLVINYGNNVDKIRKIVYKSQKPDVGGAIGQSSSMFKVQRIPLKIPSLEQQNTIVKAIAYLFALEQNPPVGFGYENEMLLKRIVGQLRILLEKESGIGVFSIIVRSKEDYLLAFAQPERIGIASEVLDALAKDPAALAELLFHEAFASLEPEKNKLDHQDRYENVQRQLFGRDNPLKFILRQLIDRYTPPIQMVLGRQESIPENKQIYFELFVAALLKAQIPPHYANAAANSLVRMLPGSLWRLEQWGVLNTSQRKLLVSTKKGRILSRHQLQGFVTAVVNLVDGYEQARLSEGQIYKLLKRLIPLSILNPLLEDSSLPLSLFIVIMYKFTDFEQWIYRAQSVVREISPRVGGIYNAWIIVIGEGINGAIPWVEKAGPVVQQIRRPGLSLSISNAWKIVWIYGIENAESWTNDAEDVVDKVKEKLGISDSEAWTIVMALGTHSVFTWIDNNMTLVEDMVSKYGMPPEQAWTKLGNKTLNNVLRRSEESHHLDAAA